MRFKTVVVRGVADRPVGLGEGFEAEQRLLGFRDDRLFDQQVLPIRQQVLKDWQLGLVRRADHGRVIGAERHVLNPAVGRLREDRVDDAHRVRAGKLVTLAALHAHADDEHSHS